jgi:hypothetical protein
MHRFAVHGIHIGSLETLTDFVAIRIERRSSGAMRLMMAVSRILSV